MSVKYSDVLERMKKSASLKNDSHLARLLGVTPQALSNYKKRSKVPSDLLIKFADMQGLSVDWLLSGEGASSRGGSADGVSSVAAEEAASYGVRPGMETASLMNFAEFSTDEVIYVGRLIRVLRNADEANSDVLKWTIDALEKAVEAGRSTPEFSSVMPDGTEDPDYDPETLGGG